MLTSEWAIDDNMTYCAKSKAHDALRHASVMRRRKKRREKKMLTIVKDIVENSSSVEAHIEFNNGAEAVRNSKLTDRRKNALENPHQAGEAYDRLATTTD